MDWYGRIAQRRAELGCELRAHVHISDQEQAIIIAPIVYHPEPAEELERRRQPGATRLLFMSEAPGMRLPLACPTDEIGRQALAALIATEKQEFYESAPDAAVRGAYVALYLSASDGHWLELATVYADLDDSELQLRASIRYESEEAVVGNWLLRLYGAYRALEQAEATWWRPIPEEANKGW